MTEQKTKDELIKTKENLESEIERLQKIIDASSETTFEIIIEDLKQQMIQNVEEEHWANVKSCIKEVDSVNGTKNFITKQSELLNRKKEELKEVTAQIDNYQPTLFEQPELQPEVAPTNITFENRPLRTGDIFRSNKDNDIYYAIVDSSDMEGKFAIISNTFRDEKLLHYPKNLEILKDSEFVGNAYAKTDHENTISVAQAVFQRIQKRRSSEEEKEKGED